MYMVNVCVCAEAWNLNEQTFLHRIRNDLKVHIIAMYVIFAVVCLEKSRFRPCGNRVIVDFIVMPPNAGMRHNLCAF